MSNIGTIFSGSVISVDGARVFPYLALIPLSQAWRVCLNRPAEPVAQALPKEGVMFAIQTAFLGARSYCRTTKALSSLRLWRM